MSRSGPFRLLDCGRRHMRLAGNPVTGRKWKHEYHDEFLLFLLFFFYIIIIIIIIIKGNKMEENQIMQNGILYFVFLFFNSVGLLLGIWRVRGGKGGGSNCL